MKILADECIPLKAFGYLGGLLSLRQPPVIYKHLKDHLEGKRRVPDDVWVPALRGQGWVVISADNGKDKKTPDLTKILPAHGVSAVFLWEMGTISGFDKVRAVISLFPRIESLCTPDTGKRFKIVTHGTGFRMTPWPETDPLGAPASAPSKQLYLSYKKKNQ